MREQISITPSDWAELLCLAEAVDSARVCILIGQDIATPGVQGFRPDYKSSCGRGMIRIILHILRLR